LFTQKLLLSFAQPLKNLIHICVFGKAPLNKNVHLGLPEDLILRSRGEYPRNRPIIRVSLARNISFAPPFQAGAMPEIS